MTTVPGTASGPAHCAVYTGQGSTLSLTDLGRRAHRAHRPNNIHVTKSRRPMPTSMAQQDIQLSKSPGFMPTSIARRSIHTAKSSRLMPPRIPGYWHRITIDNDDDDD